MLPKISLAIFLLYFMHGNIFLFLSCAPNSDYSECGLSDFVLQLTNVPPGEVEIGGGGTSHVYKGQAVADDGAFPWVVRVSFGTAAYCTGTIVGRRHILTALHCTQPKVPEDQIVVAYGAVNQTQQQQHTGIAAIKAHPKGQTIHDNTDKTNEEFHQNPYDLAIVELKDPIALTANARPICLMEFGTKNHSADFFVAGWGRTTPYCSKDSKPGPPGQLMYGKMKTIGPENCRSESSVKFKSNSIDDDNADDDRKGEMICAAPEPSIIETGDSGGPLMTKDSDKNFWVQMGVSSATTCYPNDPPKTEGLTGEFAPIDCVWIEEATNGEVKCKKC